METLLYIAGSIIGLSVANYVYRQGQIWAARFFLHKNFKEHTYTETDTSFFSPWKLVFFWITKAPYASPVSLPPLSSSTRFFVPVVLISGPVVLLVFAFVMQFFQSIVLGSIPVVSPLVSIMIQISVLMSILSLLPVPPLNGARICLALLSPRSESNPLRYPYVFPVVILILKSIDSIFGLHIFDTVLSFVLDTVLFLFQIGITS